MNVSANRSIYCLSFIVFILSFAMTNAAFAQAPENQQIVLEGSLTDSSGNAIDLAGKNLIFYISANGCYLYGETTSTAGDSAGNINHRIGSSSLVSGSPNSFTQNLFFGSVSGTTTFAGNDCSVNAGHTRLVQVFYSEQSITATVKLGTVPYAHNATMLNGKNAADFLEVSTDSNTLFYSGSAGQVLTKAASGGLIWQSPAAQTVTTSAITSALGYTPASASALTSYALKSNNLSDLASATVARNNLGLGTFATRSSINLGSADVSGPLPAAHLPSFSGDISTAVGSSTTTLQKIRGVTLSATAPVSGQVLYFNGTNWIPTSIPAGVGTVTLVNAGTGLSGGAITSSGTISVNFGTSAGTVAQGNDSRLVGALQSVNNLAEISSATAARNNLGLSALATKTTINLATDVSGVLPVANGGTQWISNASAVATTLNASIGSSTTYANIGLVVTAPNFTNPMSAYFNNTSSDGNGIRSNVDNLRSDRYALRLTTNNSTTTNFVVLNNGNVGIGVATPTARLNIAAGSNAVAPLNIASGTLLSTPIAGSIEFDGLNLFYTDTSSTRRMLATNSVNSIDNIYNINSPSSLSLNTSGSVTVTSNANSSSPYNGAMVLNGGLGVGGNINSAGNINTSGNITASGSLSIGQNITSAPASLFSVSSLLSSMTTINFRISTTDAMSTDPYNMGVMSGTTGRIIATSEHNTNRQAMIFSDTATTETFFGLSSSVDNGSSWQPRFVVKQTGNVGIGLNNPTAKLHLGASSGTVPLKFSSNSLLVSATAGSVEFDGQYLFLTNNSGVRNAIAQGEDPNSINNITHINSPADINLVTTSSTVRAYGSFDVISPFPGQIARLYYPNNTNSGYLAISNSGGDRAYIGWSGTTPTSLFSSGGLSDALAIRSSGSLQFGILSNAYMTLSNSGNVGIGTNAPTTRLHVVNGASGEIARFDSGGTNGTLAISNNGTNRGFLGYGNGATNFTNEKVNYLGLRGEAGLHLGVGANAQLTIEGGNVGIGTTSPAYKLDVNGDLRITGNPYRSSGDTAWIIPSDERLKDIRGSYTYGLREIASINTYRYNYKANNPKGADSSLEYTGVMAQEVQKQIPDAVKEDKDGFLSLNTTPIFWAMLNAIRELYHNHIDVKADLAAKDEKIKSLEQDNAAKTKELEEIKARLQRIEQSLNSK